MRDGLVSAIPNLRAFAISLCGDVNRADDLVQETLVKAWHHHASFTPGTNLKAWLFAILRNTFFSERRKAVREVQDVDGYISSTCAIHAEQNGHMDLEDFLSTLRCLSPDQREALMLVGAEGFTYEEAAQIAGTEIGTVKSRVSRARAQLTRTLDISSAAEFGPDVSTDAILAQNYTTHRR